MESIEHKTVSVNGLDMHIGKRPRPSSALPPWLPRALELVASSDCLHGRYGYRAVAPGLRGYGETLGAPTHDFSKFTIFHLVGDIIALINSLVPDQEEKMFVVGHDRGAYVAWFVCLFRPGKVMALVNLSVHFLSRDPLPVVSGLQAAYGDDH